MLLKGSVPKERQYEIVDSPLNSMCNLLTILDKWGKPAFDSLWILVSSFVKWGN